ncbi:MAG: DUF3306 domain-containing protein, partial [Pseudomonadota bacterium]
MADDTESNHERDRDEGFLGRWSRRKRGQDTPEDLADGETAVAHADDREARPAEADAEHEAQDAEATESFDDVDFEALDETSDYTRFMGEDVPEDVKNQALSKLWISDPVFANLDGLTDYSEDFTDAATVPIGPLKTAYKVGQGFLSDDEVAEWEKLGQETKPEAQSEDATPVGPLVVNAVIGVETPLQDEVRALFEKSNAEMSALYPVESNHFVTPEALAASGAIFHVARAAGTAVGCGALVIGSGGEAELKRMWVEENARGDGLGRRLLKGLLSEALIRDVEVVRLETGVKQDAALAIYRKEGFVECEPFGSYEADPQSVFMEKRLREPATS